MIELWQVSLALMAISFAAWFELDSKYYEKANSRKGKKLDTIREKIRQICKEEKGEIDEKNILEITHLYEESRNPIESLNSTTQLFFMSGISFLLSVAMRLVSDYLKATQIEGLEPIFFLFGFFIFLISWKNCYNLRILLTSENDPPITSILNAVLIGILQGIHAYLLMIVVPIILSGRAAMDLYIFAGFLFLTFPGAIIYLWKVDERRWMFVGSFLMFLPWIYVIIIFAIDYILKFF
jgi:hypothetical protein